MPPQRFPLDLAALGAFDRRAGALGRQLAKGICAAIARGELKAGERLPSTRVLAASLGLSRGTVMSVFEQLTAEGFLEARVGSGTRVAHALDDATLAAPSPLPPVAQGAAVTLPPAAARYAAIARQLEPVPPVPFSIAVPAAGVEPDDHWRRLGNRVRASQAAAPGGYSTSAGLLPLRALIADYLRASRSVVCDPGQIIMTEGTQQGLYLAAKVLLARGDAAWAEDPVYSGLTAVLDDAGVRVERVPVDAQGLDVAAAVAACAGARAAFVTPSHQYPLGMPLSMARRLALLTWARASDAWVVEDDYDSELRYAGHPFPALQGLDPGRVVYLGTFSKVLAPSLRLGYVVAPDALVDAFAGARALIGRASPLAEQHVLAAFMREGHFEAHLRRIRGLYAERRAALAAAIAHELPELSMQPGDQGMHCVLWLPAGCDDVALAAAAEAAGLALRPLSPMYAGPARRPGFMLGFGGFGVEPLQAAVRRLRGVLADSGAIGRKPLG